MSQPFNFHNMRLLFCHSTVNLFLVMLHRRTGKWTTKSRQQLAECSKVFPFSTSHAFLAAVEFLTKHGDWLTLFLFIYFYHFFSSVAPFGILTKYTFSYYIIYKHIYHIRYGVCGCKAFLSPLIKWQYCITVFPVCTVEQLNTAEH